MKPSLSVIIPGYNNPKDNWLRCVESVLGAIGLEDAVYVVDDGSSPRFRVDPSWWSDNRLTVLSKRNGGLSDARNYAFKYVRTKYVAFVDSDDYVNVSAYSRSIERLECLEGDIAVFGVRTIWDQEGLQKVDELPDIDYGHISPEDVLSLQRACLLNYAWNKVYRVAFLRANSISYDPVGMPCEDIIYNLQCIMAGAKWCSVGYVGYNYRRSGVTLLGRYRPDNSTGILHCRDAWVKYKHLCPHAKEVFGRFGEISARELMRAEKLNLLRPGSPLWYARFYNFIKSLLYVRFLRRVRIKRSYPRAEEIRL